VATFSGSSPNRALGLKPNWARFGVLVLGLAALSCRKRGASPVYIVAGPEPSDHIEFRPISSYAEYLVLPGQRRELKITLASYQTSCDSFVAPAEHDSSATITVIAPLEQLCLGWTAGTWRDRTTTRKIVRFAHDSPRASWADVTCWRRNPARKRGDYSRRPRPRPAGLRIPR